MKVDWTAILLLTLWLVDKKWDSIMQLLKEVLP